jgi:hypothetical protein
MVTATLTPVKPKKRGPGRPAGRKPVYNAHVRILPSLGEALDRYVDSIKPATTQRAVIELALEKYLVEVGFWPPQQNP